jgi:predicted N-acetyltransferase YhbS
VGNGTPLATGARAGISAPAPLAGSHDLSRFSCGKPPLDDWLIVRARKAEGRSARTYVSTLGAVVVGYYCFAAGSVQLGEMPKPLRRNMPQAVPVILIGRLAVDTRYQGLGVGKGLLKDAMSRALAASQTVGARAVLVHAIDEEAADFYAAFGFLAFPEGSQIFFMPMETIRASLA